jgi:uncharacterized repeat protein (TIGR01451 family)
MNANLVPPPEILEARIAPAFGAVFDASTLNGDNGFELEGAAARDYAGRTGSLSNAGDINGDGFDDILFGAVRADGGGSHAGAAYVIFGKGGGFPATLSMGALDGVNGFTIVGGRTVSAAGDVNGDGFADVITSTLTNFYVIFGKQSGFAPTITLSALTASDGFKISGVYFVNDAEDAAAVGDLNHDGFDDIMVSSGFESSPGLSFNGAAFVIFGKAGGFAADFNVSSLNGVNGFRLNGANDDFAGTDVSGGGDVNGDGFDDVIVGASHSAVNGFNAGTAYVVFGKASGFAPALSLPALNGSDGFKIHGASMGDGAGTFVSDAGDVNGDGFADVVIGAPAADPNGNYSGAAYVVFGKPAGFSAAMTLSALDGNNGFRISGAFSERLGYSVSGGVDINGDGFSDVVVGSYSSGAAYVVYGKPAGFPANLDAVTLNGTNGFKIVHAPGIRASVSAAGDINGDRLDDVLVGDYLQSTSNGFASGAAWAIFGQAQEGIDLQLKISDAVTSASPGSTLTYRWEYKHVGSEPAEGVVITETLSANLAFVAAENPGWQQLGNTLSYHIGQVAPLSDGTATLVLHVITPVASGVEQLVNAATISFERAVDPTPSNNTATDGDSLLAAPDLVLDVNDAIGAAAPGATLTYTLHYLNAGNQNASGVFITQMLPAGAIFSVVGSTAGWIQTAPDARVFRLDIGGLAGNGGEGTARFSIALDTPALAGVEQITTNATIGDDTSGGPDLVPENNSSADTDTLVAAPDLVITVSDAVAAAGAGDALTSTLNYRNVGNQNATGVFLTYSLPAGTTFRIDASSPGWTETAPGIFKRSIGALDAGEESVRIFFGFAVDATVAAGIDDITSRVTIADDGANGADLTPADNAAADVDLVTAAPDLGVTLTDGVTSAVPGMTLSYTLSFHNSGDQDARGVVLTQAVPAGATFVPAESSPDWVETGPGSRIFALPIGALASGSGGAAVFTILVDERPAAGIDEINAVVSITDDLTNGADPRAENNEAADRDVLDAAPALFLSLQEAVVSSATGWEVTAALAYRNAGNQGASGMILTSTLPVGATFNGTASTPGWAETAPGSGIFQLPVGGLAASADGTAQFTVDVPYPVAGGAKEIVENVTLVDDAANGSTALPEDGAAMAKLALFAPVISSNGKRATFDLEGDRESITVSRGTLSPGNFTFFTIDGGTLRSVLHLADAEFNGVSLRVSAKPSAHGTGDGVAHLGAIEASGIDLGSVTISGDLGRVAAGDGDPRKPAVGRLKIGSVGALGSATQPEEIVEPLHSIVSGAVGALIVKGSVNHAMLDVRGDLRSILIGGDWDGSERGTTAGLLRVTGDIGSMRVKGSVIGGVNGSGIFAGGKIGKIMIDHDLRATSSSSPVFISALGDIGAATPKEAIAIGSVHVRGNVVNAQIVAGDDLDDVAINPDAGIGVVKVSGNWEASSLAAGVVDASHDGFGRNDLLIDGGGATPAIFARIASLTIQGVATGSALGDGYFGIVAEQITRMKIGSMALPFLTGPNSFDLDPMRDDFQAIDFA